jgi:hypothetical protein
MKSLPFVSALRDVVLRRVLPRISLRHVDIVAWADGPDPVRQDYEVEVFAKIFARSRVSEPTDKESMDQVYRSAVRRICHEIYGPVEQEIRLVLHDLWEEGLYDEHPAILRIEKLLPMLRGEEVSSD